MFRLFSVSALVACALLGSFAAIAEAAAPAGPRLTFMRATNDGFELVSADPAGQDQRIVAGGGKQARPLPDPFTAPAWSGDGEQVVFAGLSRWRGGELGLYRAGGDGSGLRKLPGTKGGFKPVLSPDGRRLAFAMLKQRRAKEPSGRERVVFDSASTWLLNLKRGSVKRLTPWRNGLYEYPSSFTPDGKTLAISLTRRVSRGPSLQQAVALKLDGSGQKVLAEDAGSPVYSPDGSRLALVLIGKPETSKTHRGPVTITPSDLAVAAADGSGLTRLTHTNALELPPSWDPSGQRLAYVQQRASVRESDVIGFGDSIMEINADGTCRTRVLSYPNAILFGPVWQPGAGREAGPLAC